MASKGSPLGFVLLAAVTGGHILLWRRATREEPAGLSLVQSRERLEETGNWRTSDFCECESMKAGKQVWRWVNADSFRNYFKFNSRSDKQGGHTSTEIFGTGVLRLKAVLVTFSFQISPYCEGLWSTAGAGLRGVSSHAAERVADAAAFDACPKPEVICPKHVAL